MSIDPTSIKVALLCGGNSTEREISFSSGKGAQGALEAAGFPVTMLDPADKQDLRTLVDGDFDVAFLALHGKYGEDGCIQGMLELLGIPYTGSPVCGSAVSMDKSKSKAMYREAGLPTPTSFVIKRGDAVDVEAILAAVGEHCVMKVTTQGSSSGVYLIRGKAEFEAAYADALTFDEDILIESFVEGNREFTVAVIGNEELQALPIIEIVSENEFYDLESKYDANLSHHIIPAPISDELTATMQDYAVRAHRALGCRGVSRTDMLVDAEGNPWVIETNNLPGMTPTSLLPDAAKAAGISFPELCTKFVEWALEAFEK